MKTSENMNHKKIVGLIIVVVIIAGIVWAINSSPKSQIPNTETKNKAEKPFDPKNPNFVLGDFVSVSGSQVEFKIGQRSATATVNSQTKLVKQVPDGKALKVIDAKLSDLKPKSKFVVYFSTPPQGNTYEADKIQIISE